MWTEDLEHKGAKRGKIVVRTQTINSEGASMVAEGGIEWRGINNVGGGCLGMCEERMPYFFEIEKQVPG